MEERTVSHRAFRLPGAGHKVGGAADEDLFVSNDHLE